VTRPPLRTALALLGALLVLVSLAAWLGVRRAEAGVRDLALRLMGPGSSVEEVHLHFDRIELRGVRIPPGDAWPAPQAFTAEVVDVVPEFLTVFDDPIVIRHAEGRGAYFSVLRTGDRQIRFLPTILPRPPRDPSRPPPRDVVIRQVEVHASTLDLYDASIAKPAHRVQLTGVEAQASDLLFPRLTTKAIFHGSGRFEGSPEGSAQVEGWTVFASRDTEFEVRLAKAEIESLEPYFLRHEESGSASGRLDLDMRAAVHDRFLDARGRMQLTDLELQPSRGPLATFMGLPRKAVIAAMEDQKDRIDLSFEMKGHLGDAKFSLNESFATKVAVGTANALGLTVSGMVKGIGSLGQQGIEAVGDMFGSLFGAKKEEKDEKGEKE
jgi:hypothetical protein